MNARTNSENPEVLSYLGMRKAVGIIAVSLPLVLAGGNILLALIGPGKALPHPLLQRSISDYYYAATGNYFVGSLCAIAIFQICARGYDLRDEIAGILSGVLAAGTAFFPTTNPADANPTPLENHIGDVHQVCAALMFLTLAYMCLALFRQTSLDRVPTRQKLKRNLVYSICGWVIVGCMAVMTSLNAGAVARLLQPIDPLFSFETLALMAFGVAWLAKGEAILTDENS